MSWVADKKDRDPWDEPDFSGERIDPPDTIMLDPDQSVELTLEKFAVLLHLMGWTYDKIGQLFNRSASTMYRIVKASGVDTKKKKPPHLVRNIER